MGTRSRSGGILGWEKSGGGGGGGGDYDEEQQEQEEECDVGLGLRMQLNENSSDTASSSSSSVFPNRKAGQGVSLHGTSAATHYHHHHPYHHYLTGDYIGGSVHGNTSNLSQISYMGLGGGGSTGNSLHVLDCFASGGSSTTKASKSLQHHPLSISGTMRESGNVRVPFTAAQWQELERQNLILKYMMASIPVPPELLLPISTTKSFSNVVPPSRSGGDPEPWRCRRTDGKKWRCSRDVAPHQKYCERHSHKNRPRSRKPVELPAAAAAATDYLLNPAAKSTAVAKRSLASQPQHQHKPSVDSRQAPSSHFITTFNQDTPSGFPSSVASSQPFDHPRCLDWFMKGETIPNQDWHPHQHQSDDISMGLKGDTTGYRRNNSGGSSSNMDPFQLKQASQYSVMPQHCSLLLMEGAVEPGHGQQTRRFIDAWSDVDEGGGNRAISSYNPSSRAISSYNPSSGKNFDLLTSSLTLTMCGGEGDEYSLGSHRMGEKPHWMSGGMGHHGSWMGSPPGGPLAEALCLGSISGDGSGGGAGCIRYQTSPRGCSSVTTTSTSSRSSSKDEGQEELNFIA